ncbi:xanthine dehydrogenase family protein subunit M [Alphaproteobacteria bacterium]|nr:xanthine dehydrogenase family protein subunit M [Alphaproteobacteria bacterium]
MYEFNYQKAGSVADAAAKVAGADDGTLMAGGMTLIPTLKQRLAMPSDVVDIGQLADLQGISVAGGKVSIGSMTTHDTVANSADVKGAIPALAVLASGIGDPMVRNRGTMGGSVANNDPAADYPGAVLGLGATVVTDKREIAGDAFFTGMFETALDEGEIITRIDFPVPTKAAYTKFPNPASRYAIVGVFVAQTADGVRVAVTGAGGTAFRATEMEAALNANFSPSALDGISVSSDGLNKDIHASAEYRAHLIGVMAKRAVAACG